MFSRSEKQAGECGRVRALLPARQDDALPPTDRALVETHLAHCPTCAREAALLQEISHLMRRDPLPLAQVALPTGDQLARSVVEAEALERRQGWRSLLAQPRVLGWTAGLAAAAALAVVTVRPEQPRPTLPAPPTAAQPAASSGFWIEDDERTGRDVIVAPATTLNRRKS